MPSPQPSTAKPRKTPAKSLAAARKLRSTMSPVERRLWSQLRAWRLSGLKWRRQHPLGTYIVDFYCHDARMVIEVDGWSHKFGGDRDVVRQRWIEAQGLHVERFTNADVSQQLDGVLARIRAVAEQLLKQQGKL